MSGHVAPKSLYYLIFLALMIGTALTVLVAKFDLGPLNNIVMLTVACAKAMLVILYFMHLRWGSRLTWVVAGSGFFVRAVIWAKAATVRGRVAASEPPAMQRSR